MAHTYDTKTNSTRSNGDPKTFNHTCGSGATLLVLTLVIDGSTARTGGAPTYNSVAMTQADSSRSATETTVEMWYLLDPPTGSAYTISIPNSGTVYITAEASSYKASTANKTALRSADYATATSTNPTGPTHSNTVYGDVIIAVMGYGDDSSNSTASGTALHATDEGTYVSADQYALDGQSSLMWTDSTSEDWVIVSAVFKEVSALGNGEVGVSKSVAYGVLVPPPGVNVSKSVVYGVMTEVPGDTTITKSVGYTVLSQLPGQSNIAKSVGYVVLGPINNSYPMFWVF